MGYRLRPDKPLASEIRSVAERQISKAIADLELQPNGPHEAIHDARKRFKRIRALYRLLQPEDPQFRSRENARIRDIARSLSAVRDATALVETVGYLSDFAATDEEGDALEAALAILSARRDRIAAEEHDLPAKMTAAASDCREAIKALDTLEMFNAPGRNTKMLAKAWRKQLGKAHAALAACQDHGNDETYHDLRKSGHTYWMHLSLLREIWPSAMIAKQAECKTLVDLLGHEHDLSVLTALIDEQPELFQNGETLALLLAAIISRQQALRQEALPLAAVVFADRPEVEGDVIARLWKNVAVEKDRTD